MPHIKKRQFYNSKLSNLIDASGRLLTEDTTKNIVESTVSLAKAENATNDISKEDIDSKQIKECKDTDYLSNDWNIYLILHLKLAWFIM